MSGLSFLKNIKLQPNAAVKTVASRTAAGTSKNPEKADIRIFRNGSVYPSAALAAKCNLQYAHKDAKPEDKGNGFDVFSSGDFLNTKGLPKEDRCIFIALVPKAAGKVDLFANATYNEDGTTKSDVLTQGAATVGKEILEAIKDVYGIELKEGQSYMDLKVISDSPFTTDDNIYFIPKKVSRGEKKGEVTMVRREDLTLYPLVPVEMLGEETAPTETQPVAEPEEFKLDLSAGTVASSPSLAEIEAETEETPEPAAPLAADVLETGPGNDDDLADLEEAVDFDAEAQSFMLPEDDDDTLEV